MALGPSFVKAGQVLANRPDILREDYMNELCVLQDDVPSFPDEQVRRRPGPRAPAKEVIDTMRCVHMRPKS